MNGKPGIKGAGESVDVAYVAHLARLHLTPQEVAQFQSQLGQVLEYVRILSEVDIRGVEPTAHAIPVHNVFRADEPRPGLDHDEAMNNAPAQKSGQFYVPKILE
jgi:aspartyl-tRNA(Asn)/glutamyl-tRNA(Gln) amidotransferase subunit C